MERPSRSEVSTCGVVTSGCVRRSIMSANVLSFHYVRTEQLLRFIVSTVPSCPQYFRRSIVSACPVMSLLGWNRFLLKYYVYFIVQIDDVKSDVKPIKTT